MRTAALQWLPPTAQHACTSCHCFLINYNHMSEELKCDFFLNMRKYKTQKMSMQLQHSNNSRFNIPHF